MGEVELHLPADVQYVSLARLVVVAAARQAGMSGERVEDLRIAVSEATTSAIGTHLQAEGVGPVVLRFGVADDGAFDVSVTERAAPAEHGAPESNGQVLSVESEDDLAVTVLRGLADDVQFRHDGGMQVSMRFDVALDVSAPRGRDGGTETGAPLR